MSGAQILHKPKPNNRLQSYMTEVLYCIRGLCLKRVNVEMKMTMALLREDVEEHKDETAGESCSSIVSAEPVTVSVPKRVLAIKFTKEKQVVLLWPDSLTHLCNCLFDLHNCINTRMARNHRAFGNCVFKSWEIQATGDYRVLLLGVEKDLMLGANLVLLKWDPERREYLYRGQPVADQAVYQDETFIWNRDLDHMTDFITMMNYNLVK